MHLFDPQQVFFKLFFTFFLSFLNNLAMSPAFSLISRGDESSHLCWHFTAGCSQLSRNIRTETDLQAEDCCLFGVLELYIKSPAYFSNQDYRINLHGLSSGIFFLMEQSLYLFCENFYASSTLLLLFFSCFSRISGLKMKFTERKAFT